MRITFIFWMLLLMHFSINAQDIIIKTDGDELNVKVEKVLENRVVYRKSDSADSSLFSISRVDVFMIKYSDGSKEVFGLTNENKQEHFDQAENENRQPNNTGISTFGNSLTPFEIMDYHYFINGVEMPYGTVLNVLKGNPDSEVQKHYRSYKKYTVAANSLAFGSIPIGIVAGTFLLNALDGSRYNTGHRTDFYLNGSVVAGFVFVGMHVGHIALKKIHRKEALFQGVKAHNQSLKR